MTVAANDTVSAVPEFSRRADFPDALLTVPSTELWRHLPGPTLFDLPGRAGAPLFLSVLLHGNEDTGWKAVQSVMAHFRGRMLPRPLLLFVGNIAAARARVRTLPTQNDYNRTWPGALDVSSPEAKMMSEIVALVAERRPFASIDIHNNTGHNPHYACISRLDDAFLHLARLFTRTVVYFEKPVGVQCAALAWHCAAVTVECGRVGGEAGTAHAADFVTAALQLSEFPSQAVPEGDIDLLQTYAIVKVPREASYSFDAAMADFRFRQDIDELNFADLAPGAVFGRLGPGTSRRLTVLPGDGIVDVDDYFAYEQGEIRLQRAAVPAMLTRDKDAVRLDCLCYLMHRIGRDGRRLAS